MKFLLISTKKICKNAFFIMQIIENLPGNGYKNVSVDHKMFEYHVQREDR